MALITQIVIPRSLGPKNYGDFNFLINFFTQVTNFLDMGTSTALYTKLSQRPKEVELVKFYRLWINLVIISIFVFVLGTQLTSSYKLIWPNQELMFIYLAAGVAIITWIVQILGQIADAYGLTVKSEIARMCQKFLGMLFILTLFFFNQLNLIHFFYYNYIILLLLAIGFLWIIQSDTHSIINHVQLSVLQIRKYVIEFYNYANPLFVLSLVGLIVGILDRWLLQIYAGSIQQGFYGLSYQIGAICFLFTSAMTPLLLRELAIAFSMDELSKMTMLFRRYVPMLYSIAAYFSCFIVVQADKVGYIFGGNKYAGATVAIIIMAFYPIHQTYGQMCGSVLLASGETKLYKNIGVIFMLIGLPVTYFLVAPMEQYGLNAGATGLAIKMVLLQIVGANVQLFYCAKILNLPFRKYLGHQILSVGILVLIAGFATYTVDSLLYQGGGVVPSFVLAGISYSLIVIVITYWFPKLFGIYHQDIMIMVQKVTRIWK